VIYELLHVITFTRHKCTHTDTQTRVRTVTQLDSDEVQNKQTQNDTQDTRHQHQQNTTAVTHRTNRPGGITGWVKTLHLKTP